MLRAMQHLHAPMSVLLHPPALSICTGVLITRIGNVQQTPEQQAASSSNGSAHPTGNEATAKWRVYTNLARDLSREVPDYPCVG